MVEPWRQPETHEHPEGLLAVHTLCLATFLWHAVDSTNFCPFGVRRCMMSLHACLQEDLAMQSLTVPRGGIAQRVREHIQQAEVGRLHDCANIQECRCSD